MLQSDKQRLDAAGGRRQTPPSPPQWTLNLNPHCCAKPFIDGIHFAGR